MLIPLFTPGQSLAPLKLPLPPHPRLPQSRPWDRIYLAEVLVYPLLPNKGLQNNSNLFLCVWICDLSSAGRNPLSLLHFVGGLIWMPGRGGGGLSLSLSPRGPSTWALHVGPPRTTPGSRVLYMAAQRSRSGVLRDHRGGCEAFCGLVSEDTCITSWYSTGHLGQAPIRGGPHQAWATQGHLGGSYCVPGAGLGGRIQPGTN